MSNGDATGLPGDHQVHQDDPWTENVNDHPARSDSPGYTRSRAAMIAIIKTIAVWPLGVPPYQDHHAGSIPLHDGAGWLFVLDLAGAEWSAQFCVADETPVLTADLRWIPAIDVQEGDRLLGFDEDSGRYSRRWRQATVTHTDRAVRHCSRVILGDGAEVVATDDHQWMTSYGTWMQTRQLRASATDRGMGRRDVATHVRRLIDVWPGTDLSREAGYLAAAFDGEGYLSQRSYKGGRDGTSDVTTLGVGFAQRRNAMLTEVERCLEAKGFDYVLRPGDDVDRISLRHRATVLRFLGQIRPPRLLSQLDASGLGILTQVRDVPVRAVEPVGEQEVPVISTSTGTFVAGGFAAHNCLDPAKVDAWRQRVARIVAGFPSTLGELQMLGYPDASTLLGTPITDAVGIGLWVDGIFNASLPVPQGFHTGFLSPGKQEAGLHNYPKPVVDVQFLKRDDFILWVTDAQGLPAAVVPNAPAGSGDATVTVIHAQEGSSLGNALAASHAAGLPLQLPAEHTMARAAYALQR